MILHPTSDFLGFNHYAISSAYHKLVKTTPKPRATKNSKGELEPVPPPSFFSADGVGETAASEGVGNMVMEGPVIIDGMPVLDRLRPDVGELTELAKFVEELTCCLI